MSSGGSNGARHASRSAAPVTCQAGPLPVPGIGFLFASSSPPALIRMSNVWPSCSMMASMAYRSPFALQPFCAGLLAMSPKPSPRSAHATRFEDLERAAGTGQVHALGDEIRF